MIYLQMARDLTEIKLLRRNASAVCDSYKYHLTPVIGWKCLIDWFRCPQVPLAIAKASNTSTAGANPDKASRQPKAVTPKAEKGSKASTETKSAGRSPAKKKDPEAVKQKDSADHEQFKTFNRLRKASDTVSHFPFCKFMTVIHIAMARLSLLAKIHLL